MDNVVLKNISMVRFRPKMDPTKVRNFIFTSFIGKYVNPHTTLLMFTYHLKILKALHTLGFPSGSSLTDITLDEIQRRFVIKMHQVKFDIRMDIIKNYEYLMISNRFIFCCIKSEY